MGTSGATNLLLKREARIVAATGKSRFLHFARLSVGMTIPWKFSLCETTRKTRTLLRVRPCPQKSCHSERSEESAFEVVKRESSRRREKADSSPSPGSVSE